MSNAVLDLAEIIRNHCGDVFKNPTTGPERVARVVLGSSMAKQGRLPLPTQSEAPTEEAMKDPART